MISTFTDSVRPPYGFVSYPEGMNGAGYPFPNPAAAAAAAAASAGLGVHNTPALDAHSVQMWTETVVDFVRPSM
jgi:hypothetical protein